MKILIMIVTMILSIHSGVDFVPESIEMTTEKEVQVVGMEEKGEIIGNMEGKMIPLSRDRIIVKRRKYKDRHQYRRFNATKKRYVDSRWRNYRKRK